MKELEKLILTYLQERKWDNPLPSNLAKSIMIEGAELLEHFQWENLSLEEVKDDLKKKKEIEEEIADVLIYALEMTVLLGIDTEKIIRKKIAFIQKKYPAKKMREMKRGKDVTETEYWKIKKEYRNLKNRK